VVDVDVSSVVDAVISSELMIPTSIPITDRNGFDPNMNPANVVETTHGESIHITITIKIIFLRSNIYLFNIHFGAIQIA
jgi:hypothetical protein